MTTQKNYFRRFWPVILLLVLIITTAFSYAYWDNLTKDDSSNITIGEGATLSFEVVVDPEGKKLVPEGTVLDDDEVEAITYTYTVSLDKDFTNPLDLAVTVSDKKIDNNEALADFFGVNIVKSAETINFGAGVTVTVTITLNEPDTKAEYDLIAGKILSFTLSFEAKRN